MGKIVVTRGQKVVTRASECVIEEVELATLGHELLSRVAKDVSKDCKVVALKGGQEETILGLALISKVEKDVVRRLEDHFGDMEKQKRGTRGQMGDSRVQLRYLFILPEYRRATYGAQFVKLLGESQSLLVNYHYGDMETRDMETETRDMETETRDMKTETRDMETETGDMKTETGDMKTETGDMETGRRDRETETVKEKAVNFHFLKSCGFLPVYAHVGTTSVIFLRACVGCSVITSMCGDFLDRWPLLCASTSEFGSLYTPVAAGLNLHALAQTQRVSMSESEVKVFLNNFDSTRLSRFISPGCELSLVGDLWFTIAFLYFRGMCGERQPTQTAAIVHALQLTPYQHGILFGLGIQKKTNEELSAEYEITKEQVGTQFKAGLKKFRDYLVAIQTASVSKEVDALFIDHSRHRDV